jgi:hypothetical protein
VPIYYSYHDITNISVDMQQLQLTLWYSCTYTSIYTKCIYKFQ